MMERDPIVEEVRKHREAHAAKFGYDIAAICRDLQRQQEASCRKTVSFPAKRIPSVKADDPSLTQATTSAD